MLWISCFASAVILTYYNWEWYYGKGAMAVFNADAQQYRFSVLFYACNIATNIYATCKV
jgi:hypothetical protein